MVIILETIFDCRAGAGHISKKKKKTPHFSSVRMVSKTQSGLDPLRCHRYPNHRYQFQRNRSIRVLAIKHEVKYICRTHSDSTIIVRYKSSHLDSQKSEKLR